MLGGGERNVTLDAGSGEGRFLLFVAEEEEEDEAAAAAEERRNCRSALAKSGSMADRRLAVRGLDSWNRGTAGLRHSLLTTPTTTTTAAQRNTPRIRSSVFNYKTT